MNQESNLREKSDLQRIVSMLTRQIQPTESVAEDRIEHEYENRDAEHEYESNPVKRRCRGMAT